MIGLLEALFSGGLRRVGKSNKKKPKNTTRLNFEKKNVVSSAILLHSVYFGPWVYFRFCCSQTLLYFQVGTKNYELPANIPLQVQK